MISNTILHAFWHLKISKHWHAARAQLQHETLQLPMDIGPFLREHRRRSCHSVLAPVRFVAFCSKNLSSIVVGPRQRSESELVGSVKEPARCLSLTLCNCWMATNRSQWRAFTYAFSKPAINISGHLRQLVHQKPKYTVQARGPVAQILERSKPPDFLSQAPLVTSHD